MSEQVSVPVMLTFDDVSGSVYDYAFPYLASKGKKGTVYVYSDGIGVGSAATAAELQELHTAGWTVGNHGKTHTDFTTLTEAQQETELDTCRDVLAGLGITTGNHVAYPYGGNNADSLTAMAAQSMLTGRTVVAGAFNLPYAGNNYLINCQDVSNSTVAQVKALVDAAVNRGQALVLLIHQLAASSPGAGVWLVSDFQELVDYIIAQGCSIETMADLYDRIT